MTLLLFGIDKSNKINEIPFRLVRVNLFILEVLLWVYMFNSF